MLPFSHGRSGRRLMAVASEEAEAEAAASTETRVLNVTESLFYVTLNHSTARLVRLYSHRIVQRCDLGSEEGAEGVRVPTVDCLPHFNTQQNMSKGEQGTATYY